MRPSCLPVSFLVFFIFLYCVEGIRLEKSFKSSMQTKLHVMQEEALMKNNNGVMGDVVFCKQEHCTGNGRKLLTATKAAAATSTTTTSSTSSKSEDSGDNKANPSSRVKPVNQENGEKEEKIQTTSQQQDQYADIMEIAEMDYSAPKRKPPIHN